MARPPTFLLAACEVDRCRPVADFDDYPLARAEAVALLDRIAAAFRRAGGVGTLLLVNSLGAVVAERQLWPAVVRGEG